MRKPVIAFAEEMEVKLKKKDKSRYGWGSLTTKKLIEKLKREVHELDQGFDNCDPDNVCEEAVDIANFAMMIHDNLTKRKEAKG